MDFLKSWNASKMIIRTPEAIKNNGIIEYKPKINDLSWLESKLQKDGLPKKTFPILPVIRCNEDKDKKPSDFNIDNFLSSINIVEKIKVPSGKVSTNFSVYSTPVPNKFHLSVDKGK